MNNTQPVVTGSGIAPSEFRTEVIQNPDSYRAKRIAERSQIGTLVSNGKTLVVRINLRKLREGYSTFDAGQALIKLGNELAHGCDIVLTPEAQAPLYR